MCKTIDNIYILIPITTTFPLEKGFYSVTMDYNKRPMTAFWDGTGQWSTDTGGGIIVSPTHWLKYIEFPSTRKLNHIKGLVRRIQNKEMNTDSAIDAIENLLNPLYD
jgi:hypothetical protein